MEKSPLFNNTFFTLMMHFHVFYFFCSHYMYYILMFLNSILIEWEGTSNRLHVCMCVWILWKSLNSHTNQQLYLWWWIRILLEFWECFVWSVGNVLFLASVLVCYMIIHYNLYTIEYALVIQGFKICITNHVLKLTSSLK